MFKYKVDYTEHIYELTFLRAVALHFGSRAYKVENQYVYFDYDIKKDEVFLAHWNMLQLVEMYIYNETLYSYISLHKAAPCYKQTIFWKNDKGSRDIPRIGYSLETTYQEAW